MHFKKKKCRKLRGSTYHGWGRGQAHHKGAGNRGGRGRAGTGKRADAKKPSYWTIPTGKRGFTSKNRMRLKAINIMDVYANLDAWMEKGHAKKISAGFEIDLKKAGYDKLLSTGYMKEKVFITTDFASKNAVEKIKAAGGEVKVLKTIVKKEKKKSEKRKKAEPVEDEAPAKDEQSE